MNLLKSYTRVLCLHAAAKRLQIPERTLRYQASCGRIQGAFKQGKLWKFALSALEQMQRRVLLIVAVLAIAAVSRAQKAPPDFRLTDSRGAPASLS